MTQTAEQLNPESLVARIVAELQANPVAQQMLLRALLTNEFLGMPAGLDAVRADVAEITRKLTTVESKVTNLERDVSTLKGDSLEFKIPRSIRPYLSQKLALRRPHIMQSATALEPDREMQEAVYHAVDSDVITIDQEERIASTDLIMRAQRQRDLATVWIAVEASNTINSYDVERARESADALLAVHEEDRSIAAVMGYAIRDEDRRLANARGVEVFILEENR